MLLWTDIFRINEFLSHLNLRERTIEGCLETYTCKHVGTDKKLSISLENEILDYLDKSPDTDCSLPPEFLSSRSSAVKAHKIFAEESWDSFNQMFDTFMFEASKEWAVTSEGVSLLDTLCKAIDEVVKLTECEIYSYVPDSDADPLLERGAIKLKRIVTFHCSCFSNLVSDEFLLDETHNEDNGVIFADMNI